MDDPPGPDDLPSRLGKVMLLGAWVVGLIIVVLLFQDFIEGARNPNRDLQGETGADGVLQVVLQRNRAGHYIAGGAINGHSVVFLLDTGATQVALPLTFGTAAWPAASPRGYRAYRQRRRGDLVHPAGQRKPRWADGAGSGRHGPARDGG